MKQFLCMKWGTAYSADYVNRLYGMVARHTTGPFRLVCLTDDRTGIRPEVACWDCPSVKMDPPYNNRGWRKVAVWAAQVADLTGEVLYLDLDLIIVDNIDCFFEYGAGFCIIENWTQLGSGIGNSSVFRYRIGSYPHLLTEMEAEPERVLREYDNEQEYITKNKTKVTFWPAEWCRHFKTHCLPPVPLRWFVPPRLPPGAKIVVFTGSPRPHEAATGQWDAKWYKKLYKSIRPAPWIQEHWR